MAYVDFQKSVCSSLVPNIATKRGGNLVQTLAGIRKIMPLYEEILVFKPF